MTSKQAKTPEFSELAILPVRDMVLFPNALLSLTVGRESSLKLLAELKDEEKFVGVVAQRVVPLSPTLSDDLQTVVMNINDPSRLTDFIAANLPSLSSTEKQELLESLELRARLERLNRKLGREVEVLQIGSRIQSEVQDQVTQSQREFYLREQMKAIQKELGEGD